MQTTVAIERRIERPPFSHLLIIEPMGILYGSAGRFLSPENLVGRAGTSFPPSPATVSGIFAKQLFESDRNALEKLQIAGAFWGKTDDVHNFYVPTPFNYLVTGGLEKFGLASYVKYKLAWQESEDKNGVWNPINQTEEYKNSSEKYQSDTWINLRDWQNIQPGKTKAIDPAKKCWKSIPHLHPKLKQNERIVDEESEGSLFLENGIQLESDICLIYLTNTEIPAGWYRFGGEGHIVNIRCEPIQDPIASLLNQDLGRSFALITSAVWGSNRLSYRTPNIDEDSQPIWNNNYKTPGILTQRPHSFRYRLGGERGKTKRLSRGRYAVPAGTVYVLDKPFAANENTWQKWSDDWFPYEAYSFKRWGCGLALPVDFE